MSLLPKWLRKHHDEALRGTQEARETLERVEEQWPEVRRKTKLLRQQQIQNHFGESIAKAMKGKPL